MASYQYYDSPTTTREDVGDVVTNISPTDNPWLSRVPKGRARSRLHEWPTDTLGAASAATPKLEGFDFSQPSHTGRTRVTNTVEILAEEVEVSDSVEWMNQIGTKSEFAYQMRKATKQLAIRMEWRLWNSAAEVTGATDAAPKTKGIMAFIDTNKSTSATTRALSGFTTLVDDMLQAAYDVGGNPHLMFVGSARKRNLVELIDSSYGQRTIPSKGGRVEQRVDVYQGDFGTQQVMLSRMIPVDSIALIEMGRWRLDWGVRPKLVPIAKVGYSKRAMLVTEYCNVALAESSNAKVEDLG